MSKSPRILDIEKVVHGNKVKTDFIAAPFTQIVDEQGNPRKIPDLANNLKASFGIERIHAGSFNPVDKEFGPNGELVFQPDNGDARIRFVGNWVNGSSNYGNWASFNAIGNFVEITFYGTGLNTLWETSGSSPNADYRASVDGGVEGSNIFDSTNFSNIFGAQNYAPRYVLPVVSGLSLGIHTIKIRRAGSANPFFYGFEVLNESAQITVNPGQPFTGGPQAELDTQQLFDIKPSDLTGTKGGRVITYLNEDGTVGQAVTAVDPRVTEGDPTELVTNGTFDTDLTGWVVDSGVSFDSGRLRRDPVVGDRYVKQVISVTIGQQYNISALVDGSSSSTTSFVRVYEGADATPAESVAGPLILDLQIPSGTNTSVAGTFTPTTNEVTIYLNHGNGGTTFFDNVSVKETAYNFLALGDTDHSEEEIVRSVNWREFGANRGDDFSTASGIFSNKAFTLDDGTTTLFNTSGAVDNGLFYITSLNSYWTITFVGTGLDIVHASHNGTTGQSPVLDISVDGTVVSSSRLNLEPELRKLSICSGLPYGTHCVKIQVTDNSSAVGDLALSDFIIYQPKKPALPDTVVQEIADYNVMADFQEISSQTFDGISQGVIAKSARREINYPDSPSPQLSFSIVTNRFLGATLSMTATGNKFRYTFFGTGIILRAGFDPSGASTIRIDGNVNNSAFNTFTLGSHTYNDVTGAITGGSGSNSATGITGLPLGLHTFEIENTNGINLETMGVEVVTPIHINTDLKTGSLALNDLRRESDVEGEAKNKVDWTKAKALVHYRFQEQEILYSKNIAAVLNTSSNIARFYFKKPMKTANYIIVAGGEGTSDYVPMVFQGRYAESFNVNTGNSAGGAQVPSLIMIAVFGELENEEDIDLDDL